MKNIQALLCVSILALSACGGNTSQNHTQESEGADSVKTFVFSGNPLVRDKFTADPAPMVHDGRLYLYVGHDEYTDSTSGKYGFNITEWMCYSTEDMNTWTDHGAYWPCRL